MTGSLHPDERVRLALDRPHDSTGLREALQGYIYMDGGPPQDGANEDDES